MRIEPFGRRLLIAAAMGAAEAVCGGTAAAEEAAPGEAPFFEDLPVVLTATRLRQSLSETPGAVSIIDRDMIRLSGAREIPDVLRLLPGFQVTHQSAWPVVAYHGLTGQRSNRLQVLVDGRSLFTQSSEGGVDWTTIGVALDDIERIEVFRGSNSATYGSDSFLGVVNIITRSGAQSRGGWVEASAGGNGVRDATARYGWSSESLDLRVTAGHLADDGFGPNLRKPGDGEPFQQFSPRSTSFINGRLDARLNARDEIQLQAGWLTGRLGDGQVTPFDPLNPSRHEYPHAAFIEARFRRALGADNEWSISAVHGEDHHDAIAAVDTPTFQNRLDVGRQSSRNELEFEHAYGFAGATRLVWGLKLRDERSLSPFYLGSDSSVHTTITRLFANLEWRLHPQWLLNLGATVERYNLSGSNFAPRAMLNWQFTPEQTLRAGVSVAHRLPSVWEERANLKLTYRGALLDYRYLSSGRVEPETVVAREISYVGDWRPLHLNLDVRAFWERVGHYVIGQRAPLPAGSGPELADSSQSLIDFANGGSVNVRGIEYQLNYRPTTQTRVTLSQSYVRISSDLGAGTATDEALAQSAPRMQTSLLLGHAFASGTEASVVFQQVGQTYWLNSSIPVPSYRRVDLRLAQAFRSGGTPLTIALIVQAANGGYLDGDDTQRFRRRAFVTLQAAF